MCKFVLCGFLDSQTREQMNASAMELIPRPPILARMLRAELLAMPLARSDAGCM